MYKTRLKKFIAKYHYDIQGKLEKLINKPLQIYDEACAINRFNKLIQIY